MELEQISVGELVTGEDHLISRTMHKLATWRACLSVITSMYQEFQSKTAVHKLTDDEHSEVTAGVEKTKSLLMDIISVSEDQDKKRQLFSLESGNKTEHVKWPVFSDLRRRSTTGVCRDCWPFLNTDCVQ